MYRPQAAPSSIPDRAGQGEAPSNKTESDQNDSAPLGSGLWPDSKPKQYQQYVESAGDSPYGGINVLHPTRKDSGRKRPRVKIECANGLGLSTTGLPARQERPLPPDLDEKERRRILRNRASAERSRLKRLGKIAMLEQENGQLRTQLADAQKQAEGNSPTGAAQPEILHENSRLRAELKMTKDRLQKLSSLLQQANQRNAAAV